MIERTNIIDGTTKSFDTIKKASQSSKVKIKDIEDMLADKIADVKGYTFKIVDEEVEEDFDGDILIGKVTSLVSMIPKVVERSKILIIAEKTPLCNQIIRDLYTILVKNTDHTLLFREDMGELHIGGKMVFKTVCHRRLEKLDGIEKDFDKVINYKPL